MGSRSVCHASSSEDEGLAAKPTQSEKLSGGDIQQVPPDAWAPDSGPVRLAQTDNRVLAIPRIPIGTPN